MELAARQIAMSQNRYGLLVFDWDGTLMDSAARIVASLQSAARDIGVRIPAEAAIRNIIGLGLREAVDALLPGLDAPQYAALIEAYRDHFMVRSNVDAQLFPGALEVVLALHGRGYPLAIATGKGRRGLDRALAETGLARYFVASRCADETHSKPHPRMLVELMEEMDAVPGSTLMVGDTEYDMEMARAAGTDALAVGYGVHSLERLLRHQPVGHVTDVRELDAWLAACERQSEATT